MTAPHARDPQRWTPGQVTLAALVMLLAAGLAPLFFTDLFLTVRGLLAPSFGAWAWVVPVATEASFVLLYALDLLLALRGKPMTWLRFAPYPFAAVSLFLNVAAARGDVAAMAGHAAVTAAFFTPILAVKAAARSLSATAEQVRSARAFGDARRYAIDLARSLRGPAWRWRVPSLLRRQVLSGRFPAAVCAAVAESLREYGEPWEPAVRSWVLGPEGLNLPARAEADARNAAESIRREVPGNAAEPVPVTAPETAPGTVSQALPRRVPAALPKLTAKRARGMSPSELVPWAAALLEDIPDVSLRRAMSELHAGSEKAAEALRLARKDRLHVAAK